MALFPADFALRTPVLVTDKILIHNITTGVTEYTTVALLFNGAGYSGTKYWSCPGNAFGALQPDINDIIKGINGSIQASADAIYFTSPVNLPNGATVTSVKVTGNAAASAEAWALARSLLTDLTVIDMATAAINTADATITNPVIDNSLYSYFLYTSSLDTGDEIYGATITYTL